jgi:hypothetical protein
LLNGGKIWLEESLLMSANKNEKRRIVEKGSSSVAQDEGGAAHQANKQPHGGIPFPPPYGYGVCQTQAWGNGAAMPPHPPPYMFLTQFSWRSIQQMQEEGIANIAYKIGCLHHWSNLD